MTADILGGKPHRHDAAFIPRAFLTLYDVIGFVEHVIHKLTPINSQAFVLKLQISFYIIPSMAAKRDLRSKKSYFSIVPNIEGV